MDDQTLHGDIMDGHQRPASQTAHDLLHRAQILAILNSISGTNALTYHIYHNELIDIPPGKKVSITLVLEDDTRDILLDGHDVELEIVD